MRSVVTDLLDRQERHTQRHSFAAFVVVCGGMLLAHGLSRPCTRRSQLASGPRKSDNQTGTDGNFDNPHEDYTAELSGDYRGDTHGRAHPYQCRYRQHRTYR